MEKVIIEQTCSKCDGGGLNPDGETSCVYCDGTGISKTELPGNLLAEFEGRVLETEIEDYKAGRIKMLTIHSSDLILENPEKREATILILGEEK